MSQPAWLSAAVAVMGPSVTVPKPLAPVKPVKKAAVKKASKPRPSVYAEGTKQRKRGIYRGCVVQDGRNCRGVHPFLHAEMWPWYFYDATEKAKLHVNVPFPLEDLYVPNPPEARKRRLPYSMKEGNKLDRNITATIDATIKWKLSPEVWYKVAKFESAIKDPLIFRPKDHKDHKLAISALRRLRKQIIPEAQAFWHFCALHKFTPTRTQYACAVTLREGRKQSAALDVIVLDRDGLQCVVEIKCGTEKSRAVSSAGGKLRPLVAPLHYQPFSTYNQYILQTAVEDRIFKMFELREGRVASYGKPMLVRIDRNGVHVNYPPEWATRWANARLQ